ncbi:MAG: DUF4426 domain-containing protein [Methylibium sp.]|nr:DUF4426 domain-containing protein [Methylibium sp.]
MHLPSLSFFVALCLSGATVLAHAQGALDRNDAPGRAGPPVHVSEFGPYTVRASAIGSEVLPPGTAERHDIDRAADRGVLNLVILERRDGRQATVPATVTASKDNLLGQTEEIAMREVRENGRVSYFGTFGFAPLRNFRFTITAQPAGSSETLRIEFEDRFVVGR